MNNKFYGYDFSSARAELRDVVRAIQELITVVCGEKYGSLAKATANLPYQKMFKLEDACERLLDAQEFNDDFEKYVELNCKSLAEAKKFLERANRAYKNNSQLRTSVDFDNWKERINKL